MKMIEWVRDWYRGEYVPPDNPRESMVVLLIEQYRRHWTSRALHRFVEFYSREWRWLLPFIVAVIGAIIAIVRL
jgi:hypothetical protein